MTDHDSLPLMKEVEHSILDPTGRGSELVNAIPKEVGRGSPQHVALLGEQTKPRATLHLASSGKAIEPLQERCAPVPLAIENDRDHTVRERCDI
jgi:hypothetical protein